MHYAPGQTVYLDASRYRSGPRGHRIPVVIEHGFTGRDGTQWYVYERPGVTGGSCSYDVAPYAAFYDSEASESNFDKLMREPGYAKTFLQRACILDENGELAKRYRND